MTSTNDVYTYQHTLSLHDALPISCTPNMVSTPCSRSCSTRIWPPLRFMVCNTPLRSALDRCEGGRGHQAVFLIDQVAGLGALPLIGLPVGIGLHGGALGLAVGKIGRASCRERVCQYV